MVCEVWVLELAFLSVDKYGLRKSNRFMLSNVTNNT